MSSVLFNILITNLEEEMGKVKWGGIKIRGGKVYTLADDVVMLTEEEDEMRMIGRLEEYLERKKLKLNSNKAKIMKFKIEMERKDN